MAFDFGSFNYPNFIDQDLKSYLTQFLRAPAPFGQTDRMFQTLMSKPAFMLGPGGSFIDPQQQQRIQGENYLNERGNVASQNLQDKSQAAGLLGNVGSSIANRDALRKMLEAQNISQGSGGGIFGSLFG